MFISGTSEVNRIIQGLFFFNAFKKKRIKINNVMKEINLDEYTCYIGTSAKENWEILSSAGDADIFFHLTKFPSCYVILSTDGDTNVSVDVIRKAAMICKENTKFRNIFKVSVDYTPCNNVYTGGKVGEAFFRSNRKVNRIVV